MHGTVDQAVDLEEENAVMLSFGVPPDVLREVTRERDEARDLLRQVAVALGCPDQAPDDLPSSVEALLAQRDRLRAEVAELRAVIERVRPVVEELAVMVGTMPTLQLAEMVLRLGRGSSALTEDAAWLRSLLTPQPQDDR